jgi:hypothetical protein
MQPPVPSIQSEIVVTLVVSACFLVIALILLQSRAFIEERREFGALMSVGIRHPVILLSTFLTWVVYAVTILYFRHYFDWGGYSRKEHVAIVYGIIFGITAAIALNCIFILRILGQIETVQRTNVVTAALGTAVDFAYALPIILLWASLDFVLVIVKAILSRKSRAGDDDIEVTGRGDVGVAAFAKTLAGYEEHQSVASVGLSSLIDAIRKGLRMISMLGLAALVWERRNPFGALQQAARAVAANPQSFVARYTLSWAVVMFLFIPPVILVFMADKLRISLPSGVWMGCIFFCALAWSFMILSELLLMAGFYMWYLQWMRFNEERKRQGQPVLAMTDITPPSFCDGLPDLLHTTPVSVRR